MRAILFPRMQITNLRKHEDGKVTEVRPQPQPLLNHQMRLGNGHSTWISISKKQILRCRYQDIDSARPHFHSPRNDEHEMLNVQKRLVFPCGSEGFFTGESFPIVWVLSLEMSRLQQVANEKAADEQAGFTYASEFHSKALG